MNGRDQLHLLPGTKKRLGIKVPGENKFLYIGSAILGAVLVTSFAMARYEGDLLRQISDLDEEILALEQSRDLKGEENLRIVKQQIDAVSELIRGHTYWTRGLYRIASLMQDKVQIKSLSSSGGDTVSLEAFTTSYTVLAKQIASFIADKSVIEVNIGKIGISTDGLIKFDVALIIDRSKLLNKLD